MSNLPLSGKVALITGGTKGIGRSMALRLAKEGASVAVSYASDPAAGDALVTEIGTDRAIAFQADAGSVKDSQALVDATIKKFSNIDILIPCAGYMPMIDLEHVAEASFDQVFNINVKGPLFIAQKAAPYMPSGSHIVFFSTSLCASSTITPPYLVYVSAKGAIEQMTRVLAKDLGRKGIAVNAIAPGPTATGLFLRGKSEELLKQIASGNPYNRIGEPDEIADTVAFMCGNDSRWLNGQIIRVNGGMC